VKTVLITAALFLTGAAQAQDACPVELIVLGVAQDGGAPQMGNHGDPAWEDPSLRRHAVSMGVAHHETGDRFLFEATPDIREQFHALNAFEPGDGEGPVLDGVFLTHAHIGHYAGLMFLGHESMGASGVPVFAMPRMAEYLTNDGPWSQLVDYGNIDLRVMEEHDGFGIAPSLSVTPFRVPHREEFSEVVGYRVSGPNRSFLFIPDIDSWEDWDEAGIRIEEMIASVDIAFLDATFYDNNELPGRDMTGFPHPRVAGSMARFADLPASERAKVHFIHFNHSNPVRFMDSPQRAQVEAGGFQIADEGDRHCL
jgi:pyrroloquinoline quinone biosynthesis protein B